MLPNKAEHEMIQAARVREKTPEWKSKYERRAGIEGTFSRTVILLGVRRARYRGQEKVGLEHVLTAVALSILRAMEWLGEITPQKSRVSAFAKLAAWTSNPNSPTASSNTQTPSPAPTSTSIPTAVRSVSRTYSPSSKPRASTTRRSGSALTMSSASSADLPVGHGTRCEPFRDEVSAGGHLHILQPVSVGGGYILQRDRPGKTRRANYRGAEGT